MKQMRNSYGYVKNIQDIKYKYLANTIKYYNWIGDGDEENIYIEHLFCGIAVACVVIVLHLHLIQ